MYGDNVNTNCQDEKITKKNTSCKCLSLIMLDSVIRVSKKNYSQTLLKECIYETKKTKIENLINDGLDPSLSETDSDSDNDTDNESDNDDSNE